MVFTALLFVMKYLYNIADFNILIEYNYKYTYKFLEKFLSKTDSAPDIFITVTQSELEKELEIAEIKIIDVVENSLILRKLASELLINYNTVLFHASSIEYDGKAYLFTAPSGTGKSTHTALLKSLLGDKITYINDDKPFLRLIDGKFYVYGSPWCGKHMLSNNIKAPLQAIVKINRSSENSVSTLNSTEALTLMLEQAYSYDDESSVSTLLDYINLIFKQAKLYKLNCTNSIDAAKVSHQNILEGKNED